MNEDVPGSGGTGVRGLWRRLTTVPSERQPERRRRTRLLLSFVICLMLVAVLGLAILPIEARLTTDPEELHAVRVVYPALDSAFLLCLIGVYALGRMGRYRIAASIVAALMFGASYSSVISTGQELGLITLGLSVFLAGILLSWRITVVFFALAGAAMASLPLLVPGLGYLQVASAFLVMLVLGSLSVVSAVLRDRDLAQIEEQSRTILGNQEKIVRARKMEAIARLSAGVAHEFNNIMAAVIGYAEVITIKPAEAAAQYARLIKEAGMRASHLTAHLLSFSRQQLLQPSPTSVNKLVSDCAAGSGLHPVLDLGSESSLPSLDADLMGQALSTLIGRSARQAGSGGTITVRALDTVVPPGEVSPAPGFYRLVTVTDDGAPLDEEILHRIFDPFYTTGEFGTGEMDLAAAYGIISQSGGFLTARREPEGGNSFLVYLPLPT